jgi:hypothetical protein
MSSYTCTIKHAGVQLRTKVVYTYLIHTQQDEFTYCKDNLAIFVIAIRTRQVLRTSFTAVAGFTELSCFSLELLANEGTNNVR